MTNPSTLVTALLELSYSLTPMPPDIGYAWYLDESISIERLVCHLQAKLDFGVCTVHCLKVYSHVICTQIEATRQGKKMLMNYEGN